MKLNHYKEQMSQIWSQCYYRRKSLTFWEMRLFLVESLKIDKTFHVCMLNTASLGFIFSVNNGINFLINQSQESVFTKSQTFPFISRNVATLSSTFHIFCTLHFLLFHFISQGMDKSITFQIISPCNNKAVTVLHILQFYTKRSLFFLKYKVRQWWDNSPS